MATQHFSGTIQKRTTDGTIVYSTYLDDGEELVISSPTSGKVEVAETHDGTVVPSPDGPSTEPEASSVMGLSNQYPWNTTGVPQQVQGGVAVTDEDGEEVIQRTEAGENLHGEKVEEHQDNTDPDNVSGAVGDPNVDTSDPNESEVEDPENHTLTTEDNISTVTTNESAENPGTGEQNTAPEESSGDEGGEGQDDSGDDEEAPSVDWTHDQLNAYAGNLEPKLTLTGSSPAKAEKVRLINEHIEENKNS